jgi:stage II sporulation protein R
MKNEILRFAATLLAVTFMIAVFPTEESYKIYEDTLRLHILANSDTRADQDLKIGARDLILESFGGELSGVDAIDSALLITEGILAEIEEKIEKFLAENGADYGAEVALSEEWYETRDYGAYSLPRGYYTSLVVTLGEGAGQNWWCILFPPMCTGLASENTGEEDTGGAIYEVGGERYSLKFKAMEILADIFKKRN